MEIDRNPPTTRADDVHARLDHLVERKRKLLETYGNDAGAKNTQLHIIEFRIRKLQDRLERPAHEEHR